MKKKFRKKRSLALTYLGKNFEWNQVQYNSSFQIWFNINIFYKNLRMNQIQKNSFLQIWFIIAKLENEEAYWHTLKSFNSNESSKPFQIWFSINIFYKKFRMELSNRIESKIRKLKKETLIYFKKSLDSNRTKFSKFNSHYYLGKNFRIEYQKIRRSLTFIYFIKIYISIKLIKFKKTHSQ